MMNGMMDGMMDGMMWLWMGGNLALIVLAITGVVLLFRLLRRPEQPAVDALAILDLRLARGELDQDEYAARVAVIVQQRLMRTKG